MCARMFPFSAPGEGDSGSGVGPSSQLSPSQLSGIPAAGTLDRRKMSQMEMEGEGGDRHPLCCQRKKARMWWEL